MDFVQLLTAARVPEWLRIPGTNCELKIHKLTTKEIERIHKKAQKNGKANLQRVRELTFEHSILAMRGMTIAAIGERFGFDIPTLEKDGQAVGAKDVIDSDPIDPFWMNFLTGLGTVDSDFCAWIYRHNGYASLLEAPEDDDEEQKKTS